MRLDVAAAYAAQQISQLLKCARAIRAPLDRAVEPRTASSVRPISAQGYRQRVSSSGFRVARKAFFCSLERRDPLARALLRISNAPLKLQRLQVLRLCARTKGRCVRFADVSAFEAATARASARASASHSQRGRLWEIRLASSSATHVAVVSCV